MFAVEGMTAVRINAGWRVGEIVAVIEGGQRK